jgi:hypothetical protein
MQQGLLLDKVLGPKYLTFVVVVVIPQLLLQQHMVAGMIHR